MLQVRADLHTHSIGEEMFGPRTADLVARHIDTATEIGLDCIAVSDHNDLRPGLIAREYAARRGYSLLVVPSMELTTAERIHLVGVGLTEPVEAWQPLAETIAVIRAAGGLSVLPHPFFGHLRARRDVDAIERFNARYGDFSLNGTAVPQVSDSDAHSADDLRQSPHHTLIEVASLAWDDVAQAIRAGRTTPV